LWREAREARSEVKMLRHLSSGTLLEVVLLKKWLCHEARSKSKWQKHAVLRALLEVELLKKCPQLWR
jgi:hypothetical protein